MGQGDKDTIIIPDGGFSSSTSSTHTIFGDFGYGAEGSRFTGTQYGDTRLEKKLWGDADIIDVGYGTADHALLVYAGDGDDYIETEYGYKDKSVFGGRGNDEIWWGGSHSDPTTVHKLYGGLGDDLIGPLAYGASGTLGTSRGIKNGFGYGVRIYGGEGNDRIEAFDATGASTTTGA